MKSEGAADAVPCLTTGDGHFPEYTDSFRRPAVVRSTLLKGYRGRFPMEFLLVPA